MPSRRCPASDVFHVDLIINSGQYQDFAAGASLDPACNLRREPPAHDARDPGCPLVPAGTAARGDAELDGIALETLRQWLAHGRITLVYAARDPAINHAVVLRDYLLGK